MNQEDKLKALETAVASIEKDYGKGSIMRLGDNTSMNVETIPTGSISLDLALGLGGIPKGRIVEIYGPESGGKTTLALHVIAEAQKLGGIAGFVDAEHALDPKYARAIGVDVDNLYVSQPDNGEQALEIAETMVRSGAMDVVVIDSVAALVDVRQSGNDDRRPRPEILQLCPPGCAPRGILKAGRRSDRQPCPRQGRQE